MLFLRTESKALKFKALDNCYQDGGRIHKKLSSCTKKSVSGL